MRSTPSSALAAQAAGALRETPSSAKASAWVVNYLFRKWQARFSRENAALDQERTVACTACTGPSFIGTEVSVFHAIPLPVVSLPPSIPSHQSVSPIASAPFPGNNRRARHRRRRRTECHAQQGTTTGAADAEDAFPCFRTLSRELRHTDGSRRNRG